MTAKEDAQIMIEIMQHPERFCSICYKRIGICKHTKPRGGKI